MSGSRQSQTMGKDKESRPMCDADGQAHEPFIEWNDSYRYEETILGGSIPVYTSSNAPLVLQCLITKPNDSHIVSHSPSSIDISGNLVALAGDLENVSLNQSIYTSECEDEKFAAETLTDEETDTFDVNRCCDDGQEKKERMEKMDSYQCTDGVSCKIVGTLKNHRGLLYIILSSFCFALLGVLVQLTTSIHQLEAGVIRASFLILFSLLGIVCSKVKLTVPKSDMLWIVVISLLNGFAQITGFTAYSETSVGDASAIMFSMPAITGVMAWFFLKERLTVIEFINTIVCLCGVFLLSRPTFLFGLDDVNGDNNNHFVGAVWAAITLVLLSAACVITRKLRYGWSYVYVLTLGHGFVSTIASVILNAVIGEWSLPNDGIQILYVLGIGFIGFIAIYLYNLSLQTENALFVTVLFTSSIFISFIFQFALFHDFPDFVTWVGIILILLSTFTAFLQKWRISRAEENDSIEPTSL